MIYYILHTTLMAMTYPWGSSLPYNDYSSHIRRTWGGRVQKISVDAGFSCPNRDGRRGVGGCAWCNVDSFVPAYCSGNKSISDQVRAGIDFFSWKYATQRYLVYFQAYSSTYSNVSQLSTIYQEALMVPGVVGIVVGTRPDTIDDTTLALLAKLAQTTSVSVEVGIESCNDATLQAMGRGHDFGIVRDTVMRLHAAGISVGAHLILGLPGEGIWDYQEHARKLNELPITTLKIHH